MIQLFDRVQPYTLIGGWGLLALYRLCREAERRGVSGAFVECGVYRGGCAGVMASLAGPASRTWLFDSFEGLPAPSAEDQSQALASAGRFAAPEDGVRRLLLEELDLNPANISIEKGWFEQTLPEARRRIGPVAVLRLDADLYASTRCCLENLYDLVAPGGFVILDDYYAWPGCRRAVDEFLERRGERVQMRQIDPFDRARRLSAVYFEKPARSAT
jgi:O-methyltransferase